MELGTLIVSKNGNVTDMNRAGHLTPARRGGYSRVTPDAEKARSRKGRLSVSPSCRFGWPDFRKNP